MREGRSVASMAAPRAPCPARQRDAERYGALADEAGDAIAFAASGSDGSDAGDDATAAAAGIASTDVFGVGTDGFLSQPTTSAVAQTSNAIVDV